MILKRFFLHFHCKLTATNRWELKVPSLGMFFFFWNSAKLTQLPKEYHFSIIIVNYICTFCICKEWIWDSNWILIKILFALKFKKKYKCYKITMIFSHKNSLYCPIRFWIIECSCNICLAWLTMRWCFDIIFRWYMW